MSRLRNALALLRGQLWIVPALMALVMAGLASVMAEFADLTPKAGEAWWLYHGDPGTARELLASLLSGMLTMTSMVVSVTFVILTLASSQLGPRLVANFIGDRQIQAVLGFFLGTILYLLMILRSVDGTLGKEGVPNLAVTVASGLTALSLFALLFYVHKIANSIIADNVVRGVADELRSAIRDLLPDADEQAARLPAPSLPPPTAFIALARSGYVQTVDYGRLVEIARERDAVLGVNVRAGHFVLARGHHVAVHAESWDDPDGRAADAIRAAIATGAERTPAQDLEFSIRKLVEIAVRALSPGINDPFTAMTAVDRLGAALEEALARQMPPALLQDEAGAIRVVANRFDAAGLVDIAFDQIREAAGGHPAVLIHLADTLGKLAPPADGRGALGARGALAAQLVKLAETVAQAPLTAHDRATTSARVDIARRVVIPPDHPGLHHTAAPCSLNQR